MTHSHGIKTPTCTVIIAVVVKLTIIIMQGLKDWTLALAVVMFIIVDVIILLVFTIVDGVEGELTAKLMPNLEHPTSEIGVSMMKV